MSTSKQKKQSLHLSCKSIFNLCYPILATYLIMLQACAQQPHDEVRGNKGIRIGFYNVENLFDVYDDSLTMDEAFTPDGNYRWDTYRWNKKTTDLAKVIRNMGGWEPIELLGLCEIENRLVIEKLINHPTLKNAGYEIIHRDSPDRRGIDVGAIYRPEKFKLLDQRFHRLTLPDDDNFRSRDILYIKGLVLGDTLHVFFNHWPSRYGGQVKSEPKRIAAANLLKEKTDSLLSNLDEPTIIILGDFNDEWDDVSLRKHLQAGKPSDSLLLVNLMSELPTNFGTLRYQGKWGYLDQIIVPQYLLDAGGYWKINNYPDLIYRPDYLLHQDEKYAGEKPFRTFIGFRYQGGYSDHLPIFIDLYKKP
ncbi:MAG: endonuclease/exonuclease/phosphatase family protein [Cryomorphaceae bacterium]|nr:endonuclease/exonuclease/phosphatase family protein [Cryomorphaceae bacterium]